MDPPKRPGAGLFWPALIAPAAVTLVAFLCGVGGPGEIAVGISLIGAGLGLISAIYCGTWLARRFIKPGVAQVLFGLTMVVVLGVVNLIIVVAGCAAHESFH